jgi:hypothetical protein
VLGHFGTNVWKLGDLVPAARADLRCRLQIVAAAAAADRAVQGEVINSLGRRQGESPARTPTCWRLVTGS